MTKRFVAIFLILLIVAGACKRKRAAEVAPLPFDTQVVDSVGDTTICRLDTTSSSEVVITKKQDRIALQQDSAIVTDLRIFTRKQKTIYAASSLYGEWLTGTEHQIFLADGTGRMWDASDDVDDSEAQSFSWTLDSNLLTIVCHLELGGKVPKRYVVTYADDENLAYKDHFGQAFLWDKKQ